MKNKILVSLSLTFIMFFAFSTTSQAMRLTATTDVPIDQSGVHNASWGNPDGGGWYFKNPTYSNADGSLQFGSLAELNTYLTSEEAKKVIAAFYQSATPGNCTGYENNASCRPEWADGVKNCITGTLITSSSNTNGQCQAYINNRATTIQTCNSIINDGPCRPDRVNPYAAAGIAKKAEITASLKGYTAVCNSGYATFPGIDPNTGLQYFYTPSCTINGKTGIGAEWMTTGSSAWWSALSEYLTGKSGTISATSVPTQTTPTISYPTTFTGSSSAVENAYIQNLINIVNQIIQKYRIILNSTQTPVY